jgi:hypothetical protein
VQVRTPASAYRAVFPVHGSYAVHIHTIFSINEVFLKKGCFFYSCNRVNFPDVRAGTGALNHTAGRGRNATAPRQTLLFHKHRESFRKIRTKNNLTEGNISPDLPHQDTRSVIHHEEKDTVFRFTRFIS